MSLTACLHAAFFKISHNWVNCVAQSMFRPALLRMQQLYNFIVHDLTADTVRTVKDSSTKYSKNRK